jgi:hypothetical protein
VRQTLDDIAKADEELLAIDSQLAVAIEAIDNVLRQRITVSIEIARDGFGAIGFGKVNGKWCLFAIPAGVRIELLHCSRDVRAAAMSGGHVRHLIDTAAELLRARKTERVAAAANAAALLADLGALS